VEQTKRTLQPELQSATARTKVITGCAKKAGYKAQKQKANIFSVQDKPTNEAINRENSKNQSGKIGQVVFGQEEVTKFKTNYRSTQELRQPFGGSSEKINQRQLNEKFMNQTAAGSAQSGRRVKLEEHHENIKDELHHYLAKTKVTEDKKESYQRRLEQLAFEQEVGGLKTSLADGFRSQQELQAAKLHHHLDVDREKYVKRHCYDKAAES